MKHSHFSADRHNYTHSHAWTHINLRNAVVCLIIFLQLMVMFSWYFFSRDCLTENPTPFTHIKVNIDPNSNNNVNNNNQYPNSPQIPQLEDNFNVPNANPIAGIVDTSITTNTQNQNIDSNSNSNSNPNSIVKTRTKTTVNENGYSFDYQLMENYRPCLILTKENLRFPKIDDKTLNGVLNIIDKNISENSAEQHDILQQMCNVRDDCVGYSIHSTRGIILYNDNAFPLQYVRNWNFYLKTLKKQTNIDNNIEDDNKKLTYADSYKARQNDSKYLHTKLSLL